MRNVEYKGYIVGPILRELRTERNFTIEELSEKTGLSTSTLSKLEQGGRRLTISSLLILMNEYQVDANTLLAVQPTGKEKSIDAMLQVMPKKQREYFTESFLFMIEHAIVG